MIDNRVPVLDRTDYSVIWAERLPFETDGDVIQRIVTKPTGLIQDENIDKTIYIPIFH